MIMHSGEVTMGTVYESFTKLNRTAGELVGESSSFRLGISSDSRMKEIVK